MNNNSSNIKFYYFTNIIMEAELIVPFGKYKGQSITKLLCDTKYLEWCKKQEWFKKFPVFYNICVHQTIINQNPNNKTPEHNKMQNLFLKKTNQYKLLDYVLKLKILLQKIQNGLKHKKYGKYFETNDKIRNIKKIEDFQKIDKIEFEAKFNWDIEIVTHKSININFKKKYIHADFNVLKEKCIKVFDMENSVCKDGWSNQTTTSAYVSFGGYHRIYIEIKPLLGDDYPAVLRKMKQQIQLTMVGERIYNEKYCFALLVRDYNSSSTTKEELIEIFKQSKIKVVFINEIIE